MLGGQLTMRTRVSFPYITEKFPLTNGRKAMRLVALLLVIALSITITLGALFQPAVKNVDIQEPALVLSKSTRDDTSVMSAAVAPRDGTNNTTFSPIVSFSVTPLSGVEGTMFTFNMRYLDPGGDPPSHVVLIIDNTSNYGMINATHPENFASGVNYTINLNSIEMELEPGIHSYYPDVGLNGSRYSEEDRYKTFVILPEIVETNEEKWYEDECCFIPLIFMVMLLLFSIINNLIMRSNMKKRRKAAAGSSGGTQALGTNSCSNCNSLVSDDDTFCPHCGEYFDDETVCPECGNVNLGDDTVCGKCGTTVRGIEIPEDIGNREKWKDEIRKTSRDPKRSPQVMKGTVKADAVKADTVKADMVKTDTVKADTVKADTVKADTVKTDTVKEDTDGFICSMCGAEVRANARKCNECGTELE